MKYHILPMKNDQYIASLDSIAVPAVHKDDLKPGIEKAGRPAGRPIAIGRVGGKRTER